MPLRARDTLARGLLLVLLGSAVGFTSVGYFGLREGAEYAVRALLLDRDSTRAQAWGGALLAYLSLALGVCLLIASSRTNRDA